MTNQSQTLPGELFFQEVSKLFTGSTAVFFNHIIWNEQDQRCVRNQIESILKDYADPAEQLHRLSEYIRTDFVEAYTPELKELTASYNEIIMDAIYSCDCYLIAKELMKQYNEKLQTVEV